MDEVDRFSVSAYFPVRCSHEFCGKIFRVNDAVMIRRAWINLGHDASYSKLWREHVALQRRFPRTCCRSTLENYGCPDVWQECYSLIDTWQPANMTFDRFITVKNRTDRSVEQDGLVMIRANRPTDDQDDQDDDQDEP